MKLKKFLMAIVGVCILASNVFAAGLTNEQFCDGIIAVYEQYLETYKAYDKDPSSWYSDKYSSPREEWNATKRSDLNIKKAQKMPEWEGSYQAKYDKIVEQIEAILPAAKPTNPLDGNGNINWGGADIFNPCASLKSGNMMINAGLGVSIMPVFGMLSDTVQYVFDDRFKEGDLEEYGTPWFMPSIGISYEYFIHLLNMLPLSFGAQFSVCGSGVHWAMPGETSSSTGLPSEYPSGPGALAPGMSSPTGGDKDEFDWIHMYYNIGLTAKYHVNFNIDKLDVYAGIKAGLAIISNKDTDEDGESSTKTGLYYDVLLGGTWYFTDSFGLTFETGFPEVAMLYATIKL